VDVVVRAGGVERRATARGQDIHAVTAPLVGTARRTGSPIRPLWSVWRPSTAQAAGRLRWRPVRSRPRTARPAQVPRPGTFTASRCTPPSAWPQPSPTAPPAGTLPTKSGRPVDPRRCASRRACLSQLALSPIRTSPAGGTPAGRHRADRLGLVGLVPARVAEDRPNAERGPTHEHEYADDPDSNINDWWIVMVEPAGVTQSISRRSCRGKHRPAPAIPKAARPQPTPPGRHPAHSRRPRSSPPNSNPERSAPT
jgi:hypothetical protein